MKQKILAVLFCVILLPIVIFVGVLAFPFVLIYLPFRHLFRLGFRFSHLGQVYLMTTRSRGWAELIDNNVLPVLPPNMICLSEKHPESKYKHLVDLVRREVHHSQQRPYLVIIGRWRCRTVSLHDRWLEWKEAARERDPETQEKVRASLVEAIATT